MSFTEKRRLYREAKWANKEWVKHKKEQWANSKWLSRPLSETVDQARVRLGNLQRHRDKVA